MSTPSLTFLTLETFAEWEFHQERKHEFAEGRVSLFPGCTIEHEAIVGAVLSTLRFHLRGGPYRVFGSNIAIRTDRSSRYADLTVTCDERDRIPKATALRFPTLIVEVLSASTATIDRGEKFDEYRTIETCREYALIDSRKRWAQAHRLIGGEWNASLPQASGTFELSSVGVALDLDEIYDESDVPADS